MQQIKRYACYLYRPNQTTPILVYKILHLSHVFIT